MTYNKDIIAMRAMLNQTLSRWEKPPSRELGTLPIHCTKCPRTVKVQGEMCHCCEARYAYTGPLT